MTVGQATGADQLTFGMLSTTMPVEIAIEAVETFGSTFCRTATRTRCTAPPASARRSRADAMTVRSCQPVAGSRAGHRRVRRSPDVVRVIGGDPRGRVADCKGARS